MTACGLQPLVETATRLAVSLEPRRLRALSRFVDFHDQGRPRATIGGLVHRVAVIDVPKHHS